MQKNNNLVKREDITDPYYKAVISEKHQHEIINDGGILRWVENKEISQMIEKMGGMNAFILLFNSLGMSKNISLIKKMYRNLGVSLSMYIETFYL